MTSRSKHQQQCGVLKPPTVVDPNQTFDRHVLHLLLLLIFTLPIGGSCGQGPATKFAAVVRSLPGRVQAHARLSQGKNPSREKEHLPSSLFWLATPESRLRRLQNGRAAPDDFAHPDSGDQSLLLTSNPCWESAPNAWLKEWCGRGQETNSGAAKQEPDSSQKKKKGRSLSQTGSPGHIFWVVPAFKVDYAQGFIPLTPKENFQEWAQGTYDPMGLGVGLFEAGTLEYSSSDGFCGYGKGWGGYGECFGSLELDATDSSFIGDFVLPVVLHQDPRYFRLGEGSFGRRVWYSISRVFVTYNDSGHTVFYSSALSGTAIAAALSNLYYPEQDRGFGHTLSRVGIDLGNTALYNLAAEFWPDINRRIHRVF